jgi:hypothetical protein
LAQSASAPRGCSRRYDTLRDAALPADLALGAAIALEHGMLAKDRDDLAVADVLDRLAER